MMKRKESKSKRHALLPICRFRLVVDDKVLLLKRVAMKHLAMKLAGIEGVTALFHSPLKWGRNGGEIATSPKSPASPSPFP